MSRIIWGARISVTIGFGAVLLSTVVAVAVGVTSGYFGGWVDLLVQRLVDIWISFPALVLLVSLVAILGPGLWSTTLVLGILLAPGTARVVRSAVLAMREQPYVEAARCAGAGHARIVRSYVLPNVSAAILVLATTQLGAAVLAESTLSFLGYGVPPPFPTWGRHAERYRTRVHAPVAMAVDLAGAGDQRRGVRIQHARRCPCATYSTRGFAADDTSYWENVVDLKYSAEDEAFRLHVRKWFEEHPPGPLETLPQRKAWQRTLYEAGLVGMGWPREYGGQDARPMEQAIVAEEMARGDVPGAINSLGLGIVGPTLIAHGTEAQKQAHIRGILTAENIWCQLYSEPDSGSDLASLKTKAVRESFNDGEYYVVNGQKVWTSLGPIADYGVLLARTDPDVPKHQGISYFILDMHAPGVEVRPLKQITGSSEFAEVFFTNVKVPGGEHHRPGGPGLGAGADDARLRARRQRAGPRHAPPGQHAALARRVQPPGPRRRAGAGRSGRPPEAGPHGGRSRGAALCRPADFEQAGAGQAARVRVVGRQAVLQRDGQAPSGAGPGSARAVRPARAGRAAELALNSTTARGDSSTWAWNYLWSRAGTIYAGSSEIQKNIIGERVLKLPREPRADRAAIAAKRG